MHRILTPTLLLGAALLVLPPAIAHGIDATLVLMAIAIPGLGANALYWHQVRRLTLQAIGEARLGHRSQWHFILIPQGATPLTFLDALNGGIFPELQLLHLLWVLKQLTQSI